MADAVATQKLFDGQNKCVLKFTSISDGSGESAVEKVLAATTIGSPTDFTITRMWGVCVGMSVRLDWDATTDVPIMYLPQDQPFDWDFKPFGGLKSNAGSGVTGGINFTTIGHTSGDGYSIILELVKN
jgi:hypothetical protein